MLRARWAAPVAALVAAVLFAGPATAAPLTGEKSVLIVRATWGPEPFDTAAVRRIFASADAFVRRSSFGRARLRADMTSWLNVLTAPVGCPAEWWNGIPSSVTGPANAEAHAGGYQLSSYDRVVYLVPASTCLFGGFGLEPHVFLNGALTPSLLVHELGHTYGLAHARGTELDPNAQFVEYDEYGDVYSPMGEGFNDFSVYEKTVLGWVKNVATPRRSGTFTIGRADRRTERPLALRIETETREYWFEYRPQPLRRRNETIPGGVIVRVVDPNDVFRPLAPSGVLFLNASGRGRPTLRAGERFQVAGEFTLRVVKPSADKVALRVALATPGR